MGLGGWQVGNFPDGYSEWNDGYRDRMRNFWLRDIAAAETAWEAATEMIDASRGPDPRYDLILLDELNIVLRYDYIPLDDVVAFLTAKPEDLHVIVTGRNAKEPLIEVADLVTEMTMVKHPFRAGVKAQKGIEF